MSGRIVISGAGVISSIGAGVAAFEKALYEGSSGLTASSLVAANPEETFPAFEVPDFKPQEWLGPKGIRVLDRSARLLCVAAHLAFEDAGLALPQEGEDEAQTLGLACGTTFGSIHSITEFDWSGLVDGPKYVNPMAFPNTVINSPAGQAAIKFQLRGVNSTVSTGATSGLQAMQYAADFLRRGRGSLFLAGGVEELSPECFLGFSTNGFLSQSNRLLPFSTKRDGTLPGEASALCVLERAEDAIRREVSPLAEIAGYGFYHDAKSISGYDVSGEGASSAVQMALDAATIEPQRIGCIVSGAGGSRAGDRMELTALSRVFGKQLYEIPLCAPKAAIGETLGASGAISTLVGVLALQRGVIAPTAGLDAPEAGVQVSRDPQEFSGDFALVTAFGCDGSNACLVLKRYSS